jgi:hypothetical protein
MLMKVAQYGALAFLLAAAMFSFESRAFTKDYDDYLDQFFTDALTINHDMERGRLHKSGELKISKLNLNPREFIVSLRYKIKPKLFVPFPKKHREGGIDQVLPIEFSTPEGYQLLEKEGKLTNEKATLVFEGRESFKQWRNTYKVKVLPASGKWWAYVWYHEDVGATGWLKIELTIKKIKFVGSYTVESKLRGSGL